jgi:hypothetical protein
MRNTGYSQRFCRNLKLVSRWYLWADQPCKYCSKLARHGGKPASYERCLMVAGCLHSRFDSGQEILSLRWFPQLYVYQPGGRSRIKHLAILLATPIKGCKNPPKDRLGTEESHAECFMIAREELFFCQRASYSARERTPEDQRKDIVEPDHSCGSGPYEIMNDTVVAVGNPTILRERLRNEVAKLFGRPRGPVRLPVE